jgi:hypothetical protein
VIIARSAQWWAVPNNNCEIMQRTWRRCSRRHGAESCNEHPLRLAGLRSELMRDFAVALITVRMD